MATTTPATTGKTVSQPAAEATGTGNAGSASATQAYNAQQQQTQQQQSNNWYGNTGGYNANYGNNSMQWQPNYNAANQYNTSGKGSKGGKSHLQKFLAIFHVQIKDSDPFGVTKRLIGPFGKNMKFFAHLLPEAKIRISGEGFQNTDVNTPLCIYISIGNWLGYIVAKVLLTKLMVQVYSSYEDFSGVKLEPWLSEHCYNSPAPTDTF